MKDFQGLQIDLEANRVLQRGHSLLDPRRLEEIVYFQHHRSVQTHLLLRVFLQMTHSLLLGPLLSHPLLLFFHLFLSLGLQFHQIPFHLAYGLSLISSGLTREVAFDVMRSPLECDFIHSCVQTLDELLLIQRTLLFSPVTVFPIRHFDCINLGRNTLHFGLVQILLLFFAIEVLTAGEFNLEIGHCFFLFQVQSPGLGVVEIVELLRNLLETVVVMKALLEVEDEELLDVVVDEEDVENGNGGRVEGFRKNVFLRLANFQLDVLLENGSDLQILESVFLLVFLLKGESNFPGNLEQNQTGNNDQKREEELREYVFKANGLVEFVPVNVLEVEEVGDCDAVDPGGLQVFLLELP